ncbi:plasmid replication initiator protein RepSA [Micromonospora halotolerans]|uniref:Plasmid replication initiator protein RepSA n=1 Tax=Micromonospora halotolerans TaxID=709879 RepID=A0ABZ0A4C4_9ACTN|nr:replication initiator [Micromonospora halotolerans]WNM41685.1 plasmid replication initiator protein RepSA [Micromonospora halotolerans]
MTSSALPLAPETHKVSGTGASAETATGYWPWATPTGITRDPAADGWVRGHDPRTVASGRARAQDPDYPEWLGHVRAAASCKHPIRLAGQIHVNDADGNRMATIDTEDMPDGAIYTPCGNRRASVCPSCAEVYRRDTFHLIKAGLQGDRWGLPPLHEHIAIFLTATAPSFGPVHHRVVKIHAADCRRKDGCTCRASVCHPFGRTCPHGVDLRCGDRHKAADHQLGQPLCLDCYDHVGQVVWNHEAPELWRRTIQQVDRELRRLGRTHGVDLRRRYIKVYEFQVRGVIHYHALIRLDGYNPDCPAAIVPPPAAITRQMFADSVQAAFVKTAYTSAPHPANGDRGWRIAWGDKGLDLKHVNAPGSEVNLAQITGYIAKYVTKSTEVTGLSLRRVDDLSVQVHGDPATHLGRLIRACWDIGEHPDYTRLRRWAHQFGYGGHITTKSRAFSVTLGFIRMQRTIWRRTEGHPHTWDNEQTERVIYELGYQATGWISTGDALLANTAAAQARAWHQAGLDAIADELTARRTPAQPLAA